MEKKKRRKSPRHPFRFKLIDDDGERTIVCKAIVRQAKKVVELHLKAEDVRKSIELHGVGNTQTCTMSCCSKRQKHAFPHDFCGYVDWCVRTAYVVSKINKKTGMPSECYVYDHQDKIAYLNDSPGGQKKLLAILEADGDRVIRLRPQRRPPPGHGVTGNRTGERSSRPKDLATVGAKLRFARAKLGISA